MVFTSLSNTLPPETPSIVIFAGIFVRPCFRHSIHHRTYNRKRLTPCSPPLFFSFFVLGNSQLRRDNHEAYSAFFFPHACPRLVNEELKTPDPCLAFPFAPKKIKEQTSLSQNARTKKRKSSQEEREQDGIDSQCDPGALCPGRIYNGSDPHSRATDTSRHGTRLGSAA